MPILGTSFTAGGTGLVTLKVLGIAHLGWRETVLYPGIFLCLLTLPVVMVLRNCPEDLDLLPDEDNPGNSRPREGQLKAAE